jgi:hypothetical protein
LFIISYLSLISFRLSQSSLSPHTHTHTKSKKLTKEHDPLFLAIPGSTFPLPTLRSWSSGPRLTRSPSSPSTPPPLQSALSLSLSEFLITVLLKKLNPLPLSSCSHVFVDNFLSVFNFFSSLLELSVSTHTHTHTHTKSKKLTKEHDPLFLAIPGSTFPLPTLRSWSSGPRLTRSPSSPSTPPPLQSALSLSLSL